MIDRLCERIKETGNPTVVGLDTRMRTDETDTAHRFTGALMPPWGGVSHQREQRAVVESPEPLFRNDPLGFLRIVRTEDQDSLPGQ